MTADRPCCDVARIPGPVNTCKGHSDREQLANCHWQFPYGKSAWEGVLLSLRVVAAWPGRGKLSAHAIQAWHGRSVLFWVCNVNSPQFVLYKFCQTPPSPKEKWKDKIYLASLAGVGLCFPLESQQSQQSQSPSPKSNISRVTRQLIFSMQPRFNLTRRFIQKKMAAQVLLGV